MQCGRMKALGLLLAAASALELDHAHPYDHRPALLQVGFPFTMPTGARHATHADFMTTCYNFAYGIAREQNASRADWSAYANSLCQVDSELCKSWSDDLALAIEAKHSGKKYGMTYSHWCRNLYKRTTSKAASDKAAHAHEPKAVNITPATQAQRDEQVAAAVALANKAKAAAATVNRTAPAVARAQAQSGVMHKVAQKAEAKVEKKAAAKAERKPAARKHRSWFDIEMKEEDMQEQADAQQAKSHEAEEAAARRRFFGNSASLSQQGHAPVQHKDFLLKRIAGEGRYLAGEAMGLARSLYQRI